MEDSCDVSLTGERVCFVSYSFRITGIEMYGVVSTIFGIRSLNGKNILRQRDKHDSEQFQLDMNGTEAWW